jgi:sulfide:quinone oxidoreductase
MATPLHVTIVGGGFAAAEALIALRRLAGTRVSLTMVAPNPELSLRPLAVAAPFGLNEVRGVALSDLCADHQATLHRGAVSFVDMARGRVETDEGRTIAHDVVLLATGAQTQPAVHGAVLFDGTHGIAQMRALVEEVASGRGGRTAFAVPSGATWALPIYELALMTAMQAPGGAGVVIVTPEAAPLEVFGPAASAKVAEALADRGIEVVTSSEPQRVVPAGLLTSKGVVPAARIVALPRIEGPRIGGVPCDADGFVVTDPHGLVEGTTNVYAAGDLVAFPVKQGGLAAQQADAAAEAIAARAGAPVEPAPFTPVLRALLLTGAIPLFLRGDGPAEPGASEAPLWHPVGKVAARHLGPWLSDRARARLGTAAPFEDRPVRKAADRLEHAAAVEMALTLADDEAAAGKHHRALEWLDAAEALEGVLPPEYVAKRRRWTGERAPA